MRTGPFFLTGLTAASGIAATAIALLSVAALGELARAAARRTGGTGSGLVYIYAALAVLLLAGLSLLLPPLAIPIGIGLVWLIARRRRRASRKHEGLRILR